MTKKIESDKSIKHALLRLVFLIAIFIGVYGGFADWFGSSLLFLVLACSVILSALFSFFALFINKEASLYGFLVCLALCCSLLISGGVKYSSNTSKREIAEKLVSFANAHKIKKGFYPDKSEIPILGKNNWLYYSVDSLKVQFTLSYSLDGWHQEKYSSEDGDWIVVD